jgi:NitT/TauT family transport system substrate-binding protein
MKPHRLLVTCIIGTLLLSACGRGALGSSATESPASSPTPIPRTHIRLPMGYIPSVQYAPFYVAVDKGYYDEENIEIEFDYSFETDGVTLVGSNDLQFALVSGEQVLLARSQGLPVVYVMGWWQEYPVAVAAKAEQNIHSPEDLAGKRIGLPGLFGASYIGLRALLNTGGLDESDVTLDSIGFNQVEALATDQEQAVVVYVNNEPIQLRAQGYDIDVLRVADYVHLASNGVITNETAMRQNPDMIRRMLRATLRGISDTIQDPDQAFEISKKFVEGLDQADQAIQKEILSTSIEFWKTDTLGYTDALAWENMQQVLLDMGMYTRPLNLEQAYTNQYLP